MLSILMAVAIVVGVLLVAYLSLMLYGAYLTRDWDCSPDECRAQERLARQRRAYWTAEPITGPDSARSSPRQSAWLTRTTPASS